MLSPPKRRNTSSSVATVDIRLDDDEGIFQMDDINPAAEQM